MWVREHLEDSQPFHSYNFVGTKNILIAALTIRQKVNFFCGITKLTLWVQLRG